MNDKIGRHVSLTASIGIAYGQRATAEEMLADADVALYAAKADGKNRFALFETGMQTAVQDRLTLEMDLTDALESDELFLVYQPTFDLQSGSTIGVKRCSVGATPHAASSSRMRSSRSPRRAD